MIDSASETLISLAQAAGELPRRRRGRKTHVSTSIPLDNGRLPGSRLGVAPMRRDPLHIPRGIAAVF